MTSSRGNENLSSSCSALEVAPEDLACLEGRCKARLATLVLQLHANQTAVDPEAEHMAYCSPALPAELVGHEAQCLLSRCVLQETKLDYMSLVACRLGGSSESRPLFGHLSGVEGWKFKLPWCPAPTRDV